MSTVRKTESTVRRYRMLYLSMVTALVLRVYHLGSQSVWADEVLTLLRYSSGDSLLHAWQRIWSKAVHPPLFFMLSYHWYTLGDSEWMLRFPAMLFGVASVPVMYALANRLLGHRVAGIAAMVVAVSPIHVWYSQEARMYSLQILLGLLSTLFLVRTWQERRPWNPVLYVLFTAAGLYAHMGTLFLVFSQGVLVLLTSYRRVGRTLGLVGIQVAALGLYTPWIVNLIEARAAHVGDIRIGYERSSSLLDIGYGFYTFSVGYSMGPSVAELHQVSARQAMMGHLPEIMAPALVFLAITVTGLLLVRRADAFAFKLLLTLILAPAALAGLVSLAPGFPLNPRYMLVSVMPYWIALAAGIEALLRSRMTWALPLAVLVITGLSLHNHYFNAEYAKQDMRSAVGHINRAVKPGDIIIISSIELGGPFVYYYERDIPYEGYPPGVGLVELKNLPVDMRKITDGKSRAWLVLGRTWSSDPDGHIREYFDARFKMVDQREYPGVFTLCYELPRQATKQ